MNPEIQSAAPVLTSGKEVWLSSLSVAAITYLFLTVFQPFGTYNFTSSGKYLLLLPYSIIAFIAFLAGDSIVARYSRKWSWSREILKIVVLLSVCSCLNYLYNIYFINHTAFSISTFLYMFLFTFALGIPVCIMYLLGKLAFSKSFPALPVTELSRYEWKNNTLSIIPDAGKAFDLAEDDFLYAQSEGNYSTLYYLQNGIVRKKLVRITLKKLEKQICSPFIQRCHRSYIIHVQKATGKKGNAQGYRIRLEHTSNLVPVSRKYIDNILQLLE